MSPSLISISVIKVAGIIHGYAREEEELVYLFIKHIPFAV